MAKPRCFNQGNPNSQRFEGFLHRYSVGGCEKSQFVGDEMRMQTWKWTDLLQMLGGTTIGSYSHVGNQALDEVRYCLVDVFL